MAPRSNFNLGHIRHPVFLVTFAIAIPAWIIAFIAQSAATARISKFLVLQS
jgi:SHO1 osmosensor